MRAFFAIELPETVRERLLAAIRELRDGAPGADVTWVRREQLHLTLKFLGDDVADPARVVEAATRALAGTGALSLAVRGLGTFGGRTPHVVWAGVAGATENDGPALVAAAQRLERALVPLGFQAEGRPFSAHVTLGRIRGHGHDRRGRRPDRGHALLDAVAAQGEAVASAPFEVHEVVLFESRLGPGSAAHTPVARVALGERVEVGVPPGT